MRVLHQVVVVGVALALVSATPAFAGGKGGGGDKHPTESVNLNYSKVQTTYTNQQTSGFKSKSGGTMGQSNTSASKGSSKKTKATISDIHVNKVQDKASINLR